MNILEQLAAHARERTEQAKKASPCLNFAKQPYPFQKEPFPLRQH